MSFALSTVPASHSGVTNSIPKGEPYFLQVYFSLDIPQINFSSRVSEISNMLYNIKIRHYIGGS